MMTPKQVGSHEFVKAGAPEVWECKHCEMRAVTGHFKGVENLPCTYVRDSQVAQEG